jgi:hypothetical protein
VPNGQNGVWIGESASANYIGGDTTGAGNVISGNNGYGVVLSDPDISGNDVEGNHIGTDASGTAPRINGNSGVALLNLASWNGIYANVIAFNRGSGIQVGANPDDPCTNNDIQYNSIFENFGLGIDLGNDGVTPNQPAGTPGPNNWQSYPVLSLAFSDGTSTVVAGTLQSTPNSTFDVQFFVNRYLDPSGFGQGEQYVATLTVATDGTGLALFAGAFEGGLPGQFVTATATDSYDNTSEFSAGVPIANAATRPVPSGRAEAGPHSQPAAYRPARPRQPPSMTCLRGTIVGTSPPWMPTLAPRRYRTTRRCTLSPGPMPS